jgi:hypothetical protein
MRFEQVKFDLQFFGWIMWTAFVLASVYSVSNQYQEAIYWMISAVFWQLELRRRMAAYRDEEAAK